MGGRQAGRRERAGKGEHHKRSCSKAATGCRPTRRHHRASIARQIPRSLKTCSQRAHPLVTFSPPPPPPPAIAIRSSTGMLESSATTYDAPPPLPAL